MGNQGVGDDDFCRAVLSGARPVRVVAENDDVIAFDAPTPSWTSAHVLVIPKRHVRSFVDDDAQSLDAAMQQVIRRVASKLVARFGGCRVVANVGTEQHTLHLHWHVVAGVPREGGSS